ncbi:MAG TPA: response regulator transcription factor [Ktedonobacterales bacterium]
MPTRIIVVDDHPVTRTGTTAILARDPGLVVVGEAANGQEALVRCRELRPDLLLLDIRLPQIDGLQVTRLLTQDRFREVTSLVVLLLSAYPDTALVQVGLAAGAAGYVLKSAPGSELLRAVHQVVTGKRPVLVGVTAPDKERGEVALSLQEAAVLGHIADGLTTKEIAQHLVVSTRTVDTYLSRLFQKLGASNRTQAVAIARNLQLLSG